MILPIYAYGNPILKRVAKDVAKEDEGLDDLIANMWETMYNAEGVGLAAPQIGKSSRIFVVDTKQTYQEEEDKAKGIKEVFINAQKIVEEGEYWPYEEGCLSIPHIRGEVERQKKLKLKYLNADFEEQVMTFEGINARVIQHEYDHLEGVLFLEKLKPLKKRMIKRKLDIIKKGKVDTDYLMKFIK